MEGMIAQLLAPEALTALMTVIMINIVLSGDNAVVIGLAAAGLPAEQRKKAILFGIAAATVMRLAFAGVGAYLVNITGILLLGGALLFYVCWKMWQELRGSGEDGEGAHGSGHQEKTFLQAAWQIVVADVSMSLDNVLAIVGAAKDHPVVMMIGLVVSIALMGIAANFIAGLLNRYRWIAYVGLAIIVYVAADMTYHGFLDVLPFMTGGEAPHA
ncbi:integral membrane protein, YjbE family [Hartmannibacter diazotrophicus]|uniref:Integral membrane protein, YjbE family n=1 Tax=Hartmannibacter diazotrophicus TaxID=1482074 RepID=A0A2C9DBR5_9HYPH|nr:TerC family protein [Hartmannibacter diazotrophicus]SON57683.1 integral membrane protein, YjbE family [Hartmannibacter diazotrophicus]